VTVRSLFTWATAIGISVASVQAKEPSRLKLVDKTPVQTVSSNQQLADSVANQLRASGLGAGANIHIATNNGSVELSGTASSADHAQKIAQKVSSISGVLKVINGIQTQPITQVSNPLEAANLPPTNLGAMPYNVSPVMPIMMGGGGTPEPIPVAAPNFPQVDPNGPSLPNHAWPTYAPYPNYSRVAYPEAYPYNAYPFIGPFYPFPKVPLGFRSIKLEWEDGHWYYGKISTPHDYWRVRFW
jgi:hypothetical protein